MNKKRRLLIEQNEISEILTLSLGGYDQKVLIEGKQADLPIVITLHGGPGMPIPFSVGCRGLFPDFTNQFIMVYWDQLGCGINNTVSGVNFSISDFVQMTVDLIQEMKKRFPQNKIILFGMSWGSVLCLRVVDRLKNQIDAAIVWAQIVKHPICNETVYEILEHARISHNDRLLLQDYRQKPITLETVRFIAGCIRKYTDGYNNKSGEKASIGPIIRGLITSPDYRLKDVKAIVVNGCMNNRSLWSEIIQSDMTDILKSVTVPYYILQGDTDIVSDTELVSEIVKNAGNKNLHCRVIEKSGHIPSKCGMDAVLEDLEKCLR
ncbi:MAG TPA: alpha/beta hydrolase [Lachnospiraceae bacterium]|nr:alpha/beta hydrolase [Lachnospiraceae bacterium]